MTQESETFSDVLIVQSESETRDDLIILHLVGCQPNQIVVENRREEIFEILGRNSMDLEFWIVM